MIFLQTFKQLGKSGWASKQSVEWAMKCLPEDLPTIHSSIGLNRAWTLTQNTVGRACKDRVCAVCGIAYGEGGMKLFYGMHVSRPYEALQCATCYDFTRKHPGKTQDIAASRKRRRVRQYGK